MKKRLGIGIIGAGFNGRFHIKSFINVRDADITAVTSRTLDKAASAAQLARDTGVGDPRAYDTIKGLVLDPNVDVVWLCAPNQHRIPMMEEIVKYGRNKLVGIACEKPLARNVKEAKLMLQMVQSAGFLHGYLENQVFMPVVTQGRNIIWRRGATTAGRPYLSRCAEEHGGPHEPWFWSGRLQGGGVLNDMMCHSLEAARFLLQDPSKAPESMTPKTVNCEIATIKWSRPEYIKKLKAFSKGSVDYAKHPAEDFARATVTYEDEKGNPLVTEATTSWSFVGPGLRLSVEMMGPEYYMQGNSLASHLNVFFSRDVKGKSGEDLVEKQAAEQGLMPVVLNEETEYGYTDENRHMVKSFLAGKLPSENFHHGLRVTQILMACYMASERGEKLSFPPKGLDNFVPAVARGTYKASDALKGKK